MSKQTDIHVTLAPAPTGYTDWLAELKTRIHNAQQRAALAVNRELVLALLANRARYSGAAGRARLGRKGDRAAGARSAHGLPGHEEFLTRQSDVYAGVRRGMAGCGNCPTGCWTIALGA